MTLSPRDAKLRAEALRCIGAAGSSLVGLDLWRDAIGATMYNRPGVALLRIAAAKAHLKRAEAALRKWAKK